MQGDNTIGFGSRFRPVAQGGATDGFNVEIRRQHETNSENTGSGDANGGISGKDGPIFAQRNGVLTVHPHIGAD